MTGSQLEALVLAEIRLARLRLRFEVKRNSIGLFLLVWNDLAWVEGIGGRRFLARDPDVRRREASIAVLPFHSRVPRIGWHLDDGTSADLWLPPRCPEAVIAALFAHALAQVAPTGRRVLSAQRRLSEAEINLEDFSRKPRFSRRSAPCSSPRSPAPSWTPRYPPTPARWRSRSRVVGSAWSSATTV